MTPVHLVDVPGSGRGLLRGLAPRVRLVAGAAVFAACIVSSPHEPAGLAAICLSAGGWLLFARPPARIAGRFLLLALAMFGPLFLLGPWTFEPAGGRFTDRLTVEALRAPWGILARGTASMLVAAATLASLGPAELHDGLLGLPIPRFVAALLVQIVHQAGLLGAESGRIVRAMGVRGGRSDRRAAFAVARAFPAVWLPRIADKTERVAAAMDVRGYAVATVSGAAPAGAWDAVAILGSLLWLGLAVAVRAGVIK
ncbi:MAG: hypothetical protein JW876_02665 [Candidatus Krumholzibacteriota bacterium]|nr:hypothetical protein [Candidatus Krumholzibacteriota bacterium]